MERRSRQSEYHADGRRLIGYGAVFDSPTSISERGRVFSEVIRPGAFRNSLATGRDVIATYNHDPSALLGRTSSGTLRLTEDARGLRFELDLPDTVLGNEVRELVARGDLRGASFSFGIRPGGERWGDGGRELLDLELAELGPVTLPAYEGAVLVGMRSLSSLKLRLATYEMWKPTA